MPARGILPVEVVFQEFKHSVDEVSEVVEQLTVVLHDKVCPAERTVLQITAKR